MLKFNLDHTHLYRLSPPSRVYYYWIQSKLSDRLIIKIWNRKKIFLKKFLFKKKFFYRVRLRLSHFRRLKRYWKYLYISNFAKWMRGKFFKVFYVKYVKKFYKWYFTFKSINFFNNYYSFLYFEFNFKIKWLKLIIFPSSKFLNFYFLIFKDLILYFFQKFSRKV